MRLIWAAFIIRRHDALEALEPLIPNQGWIRRFYWLWRPLNRRSQKGRPGERLARALINMGPAFVKIGQILSTRPDILGDDTARALTRLQDNLTPSSETQVRTIIESELGMPWNKAFRDISPAPLSTASLAQVHEAILPDGQHVVIKVLRPEAVRDFMANVKSLAWAGNWFQRLGPLSTRHLKIRQITDQIRQQSQMELDMRIEAAAMGRLADQLAHRDDVMIPKVIWDLTTKQILTMSRLDFISMDEPDAMRNAGHDVSAITTIAAQIFFESVFEHGYFHGDQHAGNMGVTREGKIAFIDFGIMGFVSMDDRIFLANVLSALVQRQYEKVSDHYIDAGYLRHDEDENLFAQSVRAVVEPIMNKPLHEISFGQILGELFIMSQRFEMEIPASLFLLQKNMLMAEGTARQLTPDLNIWELGAPLVTDWMRRHRGPQARVLNVVKTLIARIEQEAMS